MPYPGLNCLKMHTKEECSALNIKEKCEGRDLNPRTSARADLESASVDQAWIPSLQKELSE